MSKIQIRKRLSKEEADLIDRVRAQNKGIVDAADEMQLDPKNVPAGWIKTKGASLYFKNPLAEEDRAENLDLTSIVKTLWPELKSFDHKIKDVQSDCHFDRLVYTDTHIGMCPDQDGNALYPATWSEDDIMNAAHAMINYSAHHRKSPVIYIDDLGDLMDGWDGYTTRGGHKLPQNMSNQEAYNVAVQFKLHIIRYAATHYEKVICRNVCNSNHGGDFDYVVNEAVRMIAETAYSNVKIHNLNDFIDYYTHGKWTFAILHGKDTKHAKKPFPAALNPETKEKLENWLIYNNLLGHGEVEVSKGDSHQMIFDRTTSQYFDYCSYPALSPSSQYIQSNYKKGMRGFVFQNFNEQKTQHEYKF